MSKYKYKKNIVFFDPKLNKVFQSKTNDTIRFDSISEFKLYKFLKQISIKYNLDIDIDTHYTLYLSISLKWRVDFKINCNCDESKKLFSFLLKKCSFSDVEYSDLNYVYLEYKGLIDLNYKAKQDYILKNRHDLNKRLIVICSESCAILNEDLESNIETVNLIKPIYSESYFKKAVEFYFKNGCSN